MKHQKMERFDEENQNVKECNEVTMTQIRRGLKLKRI